MRSSQKNIVKMKNIDLDDNVNESPTTRVEWNVSVSRPSFSIPDSNTALFYKNAYENLMKPNSMNQLQAEPKKVNSSVNALLSPRMNFRASKSLSTRESSITSTTEDEDGLVQINQYRVLEDLGRGAYGFVKLVEDNDGHLFALKIISKRKLMKSSGYFRRPPPLRNSSTSSFCEDINRGTVSETASPTKCFKQGRVGLKLPPQSCQEKNLWSTNDSSKNEPYLDPLRRVYQEIAIYKKLDNPHIVKLHEVIDEPDQDNLYMIFEHIEGGPVMNVGLSEPLPEDLTRKYFRDILCGLDYLHFNKIIHRDIKPSNLLVDKNGVVKLIDFGVSCQFTGDDIFLQDTLGSPAFLAPECVQDCHGKFTGKALDIWALGMTLHCLLFGKVAFDSRNKIDLYHSIATKPIVLPKSPDCSSEVRDLLMEMLNKLPTSRITLNAIKQHPWVTENGKWLFPHLNQEIDQQIQVSDKEIDQCTVKPVRIQTIVSALMMARRRSFKNPKKCFDNFIKYPDPRSEHKSYHHEYISSFSNSHKLGDQANHSPSTEIENFQNMNLEKRKNSLATPFGELRPSTSKDNLFNSKNIFTRLDFSSSESSCDDEIK